MMEANKWDRPQCGGRSIAAYVGSRYIWIQGWGKVRKIVHLGSRQDALEVEGLESIGHRVESIGNKG